ncbi:HEPN domain-containing protein [Flavivirga jejuensis]|uniref:HEPN domain-containing protein n=1 Tax=Flavivirga jejuensis TaxID=870487 RepID=A0ABT8WIE8_9FLAO|nr:HEPN domain-containing protein [Flavivirga jejuensis]MDO5972936.1 HEPN domain-containing protein [Flavivirga jejuensis]
METKAKKIFEDAVEKLNEANKELFRPEEDIVTYSVCKNAQHAIENFLKGYLLKNNIDPSNLKTIDNLYKECVKINKNSEKVNLEDLQCKSSNMGSMYCNKVSEVRNCFEIANNLDTFFRREKII